jgi:hypothetical protein
MSAEETIAEKFARMKQKGKEQGRAGKGFTPGSPGQPERDGIAIKPTPRAGLPFPVGTLDKQFNGAPSALIEQLQIPSGLAGASLLAAASLATSAHAQVVLPFHPTLSEHVDFRRDLTRDFH